MRRSTLHLGFAGILLIGAGILLGYRPARAEIASMVIAPSRLALTASAGDTLSETLTFWHAQSTPMLIHPEGADFTPEGEDGKIVTGEAPEAGRSLKDWIAPSVTLLSVPPNQQTPVAISIHVPPSVRPGAYWGSVVLHQVGNQDNPVRFNLSAVILLNVRGQAPEKLTVASFTGTASATRALAFVLRLRNDGAFYEKPQSTITVRNIFGTVVAEAPVPEENVLPGYVRRFAVAVGNSFWPGAYLATITATYGSGQVITAERHFWIVPKDTGWAVLAVIVALGLGGLIVARRRGS